MQSQRYFNAVFGTKSHIVLTYTDDIMIISRNERDMIDTFSNIETIATEFSLEVNIDKIKILHVARKQD